MVTYTAQVNLLTMMTIQIDINNPVGMRKYLEINTVKMYRTTYGLDIFLIVLEAIYAAYTTYFTIVVFAAICEQKRKYFKNVWSYLDICVVIVSFCVVATYISHVLAASSAVLEYQTTKNTDQFHTVLLIDNLLATFLAILVTIAALKLVHMFRFNPVICRFFIILDRAKTKLFVMTIFINFYYMQFASVLHLLAVPYIAEYNSLGNALITLFTATLGNFDMKPLALIHPTWGPLLLIVFLLTVLYIALNLFISVLCYTLTEVFKEELPREEARLLNMLFNKLLQWGFRRETLIKT